MFDVECFGERGPRPNPVALSPSESSAAVHGDAPDDDANKVELNRAAPRELQSFTAIHEAASTVPPARIERATYGLGNRRSIH